MTANQLRYWELQENKRSNLAKEIETNRSNLAKESETHRSNLAQETETHRSNTTQEAWNAPYYDAKTMESRTKSAENLTRSFKNIGDAVTTIVKGAVGASDLFA